jgi:uncharacterized protein YozE (UPF0346 family)
MGTSLFNYLTQREEGMKERKEISLLSYYCEERGSFSLNITMMNSWF